MNKLLLFILALSFLNAEHFAINYKTSYKNPQAKAILKDYERFMNKIESKSEMFKLRSVNTYINSLNAIYDSKNPDTDIWSTRLEFLNKGGGDCEDYAIAKYYTLKDLGINPKNMCLIIVKEGSSNYYHLVLGVWQKQNSSPLILDNLSFKVLPFTKRIDLKPDICMNEFGSFKVTKNGKKRKINITYKAYKDMLKRAKKENFWLKK